MSIDVTGKRLFLSGPMSGFRHYNAKAFVDAHVRLKDVGVLHAYDPALAWLDEEGEPRSHEHYMRKCIGIISSGEYDLLVSLPGWEMSEGAKLEREVAMACGMRVCELHDILGGNDGNEA